MSAPPVNPNRTKPAPGKRLLELDVLRFVAIVLVLGRHMVPCPSEISTSVAAVSGLWYCGGWIGVDLFFVLSGFLVSGLLFREYSKYGSIDMPRFLIRRAFKIYPAFWALIATTLLLGSFGFPLISNGSLASELLFVQNYFPGLWNHTWSLAVEEHFYLFLAAVVMILVYRGTRDHDPLAAIPKLFVGIAVACLVMRIVTTAVLPYHYTTHLFPTHLRIDSLMFGVLLAYSWHRNGLVRSDFVRERANALILGGVILLLPAFAFPVETTPWVSVIGVVGFYLGSGAILIGLLHRGLPGTGLVRMTAALGAYSYSIYLWHMPVHQWLVPTALTAFPSSWQGNWALYLVLYVTGSCLIGVAMAKLIEVPVLAIRERWFPSRSKALARSSDASNRSPASRSSSLGGVNGRIKHGNSV